MALKRKVFNVHHRSIKKLNEYALYFTLCFRLFAKYDVWRRWYVFTMKSCVKKDGKKWKKASRPHKNEHFKMHQIIYVRSEFLKACCLAGFFVSFRAFHSLSIRVFLVQCECMCLVWSIENFLHFVYANAKASACYLYLFMFSSVL